MGTIDTCVHYKNQSKVLPLIVVAGNEASLFGRIWLSHFQLDWPEFEQLLQCHVSLFGEELGLLKGQTAKIFIPADTRPRFFKARRLPYSLKAKVEHELDRLQADRIISPVRFSDWATPIVPVVKSNGDVCVW